jgi:predicted nucleic acid-binding Zn ribbon protein
MPIQHCETCDREIDLDEEVEHIEDCHDKSDRDAQLGRAFAQAFGLIGQGVR